MKKTIFSILALSLIAGSISGQKKIDIEKVRIPAIPDTYSWFMRTLCPD